MSSDNNNNDLGVKISKPTSFTPNELRKLQDENPDAVEVYEFEYDTVERVLPALEVRAKMLAIKKRFDEIVSTQGEDLTDEEIQGLLEAEDKAWKSFTHTHPTFYKKMTTRTTPASVVTNLLAMVQTKHLIETGQVDEEAAMMSMQESLQRQYTKK